MRTKHIWIAVVFTAILFNNGCAAATVPPPVTYFPVQNQTFQAYPALGMEGTLVLENGTLRIMCPEVTGNVSYLPVWPMGFSWRDDDGRITLINNKNEAVARVGDKIRVGGASLSMWMFEKYTFPPIPKDCPGPYWFASPRVKDTTWDIEKSWEKFGLPEK